MKPEIWNNILEHHYWSFYVPFPLSYGLGLVREYVHGHTYLLESCFFFLVQLMFTFCCGNSLFCFDLMCKIFHLISSDMYGRRHHEFWPEVADNSPSSGASRYRQNHQQRRCWEASADFSRYINVFYFWPLHFPYHSSQLALTESGADYYCDWSLRIYNILEIHKNLLSGH